MDDLRDLVADARRIVAEMQWLYERMARAYTVDGPPLSDLLTEARRVVSDARMLHGRLDAYSTLVREAARRNG